MAASILAPLSAMMLVVPAGASAHVCFELARTVGHGEPIALDSAVSVSCRAVEPVALRYDHQDEIFVSDVDLEAGAYLGRVSLKPLPAIRKGAVLNLISRQGPILVERAVTSMQPGRAGGHIFVRDAEGQVFSAAVADGKR